MTTPFDFGALGDGAANDAVALQAFLDHIATGASGRRGFIPAGHTFCFSDTIAIRNGTKRLVGLGGTLKATGAASIVIGTGMSGGEVANDLTVQGLIIDMNGQTGNALWGGGCQRVHILDNRILNCVGNGILVRAYQAADQNVRDCIIQRNFVHCTASTAGYWGIAVDAETASDAQTVWRANPGTLVSETRVAEKCIVSGNIVIGGYYGLALRFASHCLVSGNITRSNVRGIVLQNSASHNLVSGNTIIDSESSSILVNYGSSYNTIELNLIDNALSEDGVSNGAEALINNAFGAQFNVIRNNRTRATNVVGPQQHVWIGPHSNGTIVENHRAFGTVSRAYYAVESAFDTTTSDQASFSYGKSNLEGYADTAMSDVGFVNCHLRASSSKPAVAMFQFSDATFGPVGLGATVKNIDQSGASTALKIVGTVTLTAEGSGLTNAANDGAAATAGVQVGQFYRNGSVVMVRVS